jgi:tetratricopeptide (TPR) repeat protein
VKQNVKRNILTAISIVWGFNKMKSKKNLWLVFTVSFVCMVFVYEHAGVKADDTNTGVKERRKYLVDLWRTTRIQVGEKEAQGQYDDAIKLIEEAMEELGEADYEELPDIAGRFHSTLSDIYFSDASKTMTKSLQSQQKCVELFEKSDHLAGISMATSSLASIYMFVGALKTSEETHEKAVEYAELVPLDDPIGRHRAAFMAKDWLLSFYKNIGEDDKAREIGKELELMIERKQMKNYTKEYIRKKLERERD